MPSRHGQWRRRWGWLVLGAGVICGIGTHSSGAQVVLFEESFENEDWDSRGWYDGPHMETTSSEHIEGSTRACVWHWSEAGNTGTQGGGARRHLPPLEDVTLEFHMKHSENWTWTGKGYHPHEFHFITSEDWEYVGPARTHLTLYVEVVNGVPRLAIQDGSNIDEEHVEEDLVGVTEERAVAGCNGDSDGHGEADCYRSGEGHANGKFWEPEEVYFGEEPGPRYKGDWHHVRVRFRLNSVQDGVGLRDGVMEYWFDGELIINHRDVVFRTGQHPDMKINQFLMAPYYGPGVPHEQRIWIDDLRILSGVGDQDGDTSIEGPDSTWGQIKKDAK